MMNQKNKKILLITIVLILAIVLIAVLLIRGMMKDDKPTGGNGINTEKNYEHELTERIEGNIEDIQEVETEHEEVQNTPPVTSETIQPEQSKPKWMVADIDKTMYAKSSVNVRKGPGTEYEKLGSLSTNQEVKVTGKCNEFDWYRINYNNSVAYVSNSYLSDEKVVVNTPNTDKNETTSGSNSETNSGTNSGSNKNDDWEGVSEPSKEPVYGMIVLDYVNSSNLTEEEKTGWDFEIGIRYFVWVANSSEENGGHWEARYEGDPNNKFDLDRIIEDMDFAYDCEGYTKPERAGTYDGEEVRNDRIVYVYLGGGLLDKYK